MVRAQKNHDEAQMKQQILPRNSQKSIQNMKSCHCHKHLITYYHDIFDLYRSSDSSYFYHFEVCCRESFQVEMDLGLYRRFLNFRQICTLSEFTNYASRTDLKKSINYSSSLQFSSTTENKRRKPSIKEYLLFSELSVERQILMVLLS